MPESTTQLITSLAAQMGGWTTTALRVALIVGAAWALVYLLHRLARSFFVRIATSQDDREAAKRAQTLGRVFRYLISVVVWLVAGTLVLAEIGISVAPILGAAGVAGLAVGFGAQSLVKDFFNGFFLLLENQIRQGDLVKLGEHSGIVEEMTLRYVRLRDYDGHVHFVPNGEVRSVTNLSRDFAHAVVDIGVAYSEDIDRVTAVMQQVAAGLREDAQFASKILADFDLAGVDRLDDSAVVVRGRFRVAPLEQAAVRREYLKRLKAAFDQQGIEIPFPQMTLHRAASNPAAQAPTPSDPPAPGHAKLATSN